MFLKDDKYEQSPIGDMEMKAPRCIQYRTKEYNILLGKYIHPLEKHIYQLKIGLALVCSPRVAIVISGL